MKKLLLPGIAMFLLLVASATATITSDNVMGYWRCDDNLLDSSENVTHFSNDVGAIAYAAGKIGNACDFDASDRLNMTFYPNSDIRTVEYWIYYDDVSLNMANYAFNVNDYWYMSSGANAQRISTGAGTYLNSATKPKAGEWYHIVAVIGTGGMRLYMNGVLNASNAAETLLADGSIYVGADSASSEKLDGKIDNIVFYNTQADAADIANMWNGGSGWVPPISRNFRVTAEDSETLSTITTFNITINNTWSYNTTNGTIVTNLLRNETSVYNISFFAENFDDANFSEVNVSVDYIGLLNFSNYMLNITAEDLFGNEISNFTVMANSSTNKTAENGTTIIYLRKNSYHNISITSPNYVPNWTTLYLNVTSYILNFSLYFTNSINFTFRREGDNALINWTNVDIEMISDISSYNYTTPNGSIYVSLLSPSIYTIRYSALGFLENFHYFNLVNSTYNQLNLYLTNATIASNITATVYDLQGDVLADVYIKAHRYDLATNSYVLVSEAKTNMNGQTILTLYKNTEYYKFFLYYPLGTLKEETSPSYIYSDTLSFRISSTAPVAEDFYNYNDIVYSLDFNNVTLNFRFSYSDPNSEVSQACLRVYRLNYSGDVAYSNQCISGSSGTILSAIPYINDTTYEARGFVTLGGHEYLLASIQQSWYGNYNYGFMGLFGIVIITMIFIFVAFFKPALGVLLAPLPTIYGAAANLINLNVGIAIGIEIVAVIIAIIIARE